jgi:NAD(P)H-hydrate repair Nnr-like enzyme with NAD(P)H-hydrate epimerase domain
LNYEFSLYTDHPSDTQDKKKNNQKQKQSNQKRGRHTQSQQDGTSCNDDSSSEGVIDAVSGKGLNGNKKKRIYLQHRGRVVTETNQ